jgi:hypothetical protein
MHEAVDSHNLLDLSFGNFTGLKSFPADSGFLNPYTYHPSLSTGVLSPLVTND